MSTQTSDNLQAGVVGATIRVTCVQPQTAAEKAAGAPRVPLDISASTVHELIFRRPDGSVVTKPALFVTDGADGALQWTSQAGDVEPWGTYSVQPNIVMPSFTGRGQRAAFEVLKNL